MIHRALLMNSSHISYKSCTTYIMHWTYPGLPKTTLAIHFAPVARSQGPMNDQLSAQQRRRFIQETTTTHFALNIYQKTTPSQHTSCGIFIFKTTSKGLFIQRKKTAASRRKHWRGSPVTTASQVFSHFKIMLLTATSIADKNIS